MTKPPMLRSPEGDRELDADLARFEEGRADGNSETKHDHLELSSNGEIHNVHGLSPEDVEELRKYRVLVHESRTRGWRGLVQNWLGITAVLNQYANKSNELFAVEIRERRRMQIAVTELTELGSFLAREIASLKQRRRRK